MRKTVAIYTRVSKDDRGEQTATHRQELACRRFAALQGWEVGRVFEDVDVSAYRAVFRVAYEELVAEIKAGRVHAVLVWKLDRLARRPAEFERFWACCESRSVSLASVTEPIDSSTEMGMAMVRILVTFAQMESATKGLRIAAKAREMAEAGHTPSGPRAYGYTRDRRALVTEEADMIREGAARVLAGNSLRSIVGDWNRRGVPSPRGRTWNEEGLRSLLYSRRHTGERTYHGEVVASGCWPAILEPTVAAEVRAVFASRARGPNPAQSRHLLAGLLRCAECGNRMASNNRQGRPSFGCVKKSGGCGGVWMVAAPLEEWTAMMVLWHRAARARANARRPPPPPDPTYVLAGLEADTDALRQLCKDFYVHRAMTRPAFEECRTVLEARLGGFRRQLTPPKPAQNTTALRARWRAMSRDERRAVIVAELDHITVRRAQRPGSNFEAERLQAHWCDDVPNLGSPPTMVWVPAMHRRPPPPPPGADATWKWWSTAEAARYLGYRHTSTVLNHTKRGLLAPLWFRGGYWYTKAQLDAHAADLASDPVAAGLLRRSRTDRDRIELRPPGNGAPWLTSAQVSARLGLRGVLWVRQRIRTGEIPAIKKGPSYWVSEADLDDYIQRCRIWPAISRQLPEAGSV